MADSKNDLAGWADSLDEDAPVEGLDKDTLRRAMELNPQLKAQLGGTNKVVQQLEQAAQHNREAKADAPRRQGNAASSLAEGVRQAQERYQTEVRRLQQQLAKTQQEMAQLKPQTLDRLIEMVIAADPNMSSVYTQELLKMQAPFLNEVGFSARKVIERQLKKR